MPNEWEKQADDNNDKQWLDWLKNADKRASELEEEQNFIDIARRAELEFRLSSGTCNQSDEIYIEDIIMMDESMPIIYSYTDDQAVEDGVLVPISNLNLSVMNKIVDRITISLWDKVVKNLPKDSNGCIPQPALESELMKVLTGLSPHSPQESSAILKNRTSPYGLVWCVLNERDRWTLMFPSDY